MIPQNQQLLNFLLLQRGMVHNSVSMVLQATACINFLLKEKYGYGNISSLGFSSPPSPYGWQCLLFCNKMDQRCRQLLLRCKIFLFRVEKRRLYSVHKKASCGDLHLCLHHSLVIRLVAFHFCPGFCWRVH